MLRIYDRIFEQPHLVDVGDREPARASVQWIDEPGCVLQRLDAAAEGGGVRHEPVAKPGLFLTVGWKGLAQSSLSSTLSRLRHADHTVAVLAVRAPASGTEWSLSCAGTKAVGLAFPQASIERLGLLDQFLALFPGDEVVRNASLQASPRILVLAADMLAPGIAGREGELLLSAHATEMLARVMSALRERAGFYAGADQRQVRLQAVRDMVDADLQRPWSIAELASEAGVSRRSFNLQFHKAFGVSAADYLRTRRLETAREAILLQGLSVTEAAYRAGYGSPANFATAFRRHFGYAPSRCRI